MRRKIPTIQSLCCFEAAARHESYTRAAQELALTQGAVSRQIASLEEFLGVPLFRRTRHGVALTPAGVAYGRQIAGRLNGLERDTIDVMSMPENGGAIQLAAVPTFATRWLLPRLVDFAAQHPDTPVHIETQTRPFMFADSGFDAALYAGTAEQLCNWPGTRATLLMQEEVVPVASPQLLAGRSRWHPRDLLRLPLLQQSTRPDAWRQWFDAMGVSASPVRYGPRYELFSMLTMAASCGLGVALIPKMLIEPELARGELGIACNRPLRGARGYYLVTPESGEERQALANFRAWLLLQAGGTASPALGK
ncbi:LysR substrate-binding domain-containing protein [Denitratisoma oestradiolicum]|uniref:LysR family transcriptional regulator, glycine cleavage system transcriptional activator n=1 Tax=Denitratisoma oestradiolicum TaxID=311182 RepID=A0A6S6XR67_9PROT|nr:LysR substrate-binding domain-containing protein [Denitratisoma oestradiolicum]TWO79466.1 LysR family transcriptional regulator [Denitratisoma oestradiolicum]CAB1368441.1 LysR family transcriptional regulator, glycine cleavage system transcriptional activator [Denitratisoma oestradiolicum]